MTLIARVFPLAVLLEIHWRNSHPIDRVKCNCNRYGYQFRYEFVLCIVSGYEFRRLVCLVSLFYVLFQDTSSGDL